LITGSKLVTLVVSLRTLVTVESVNPDTVVVELKVEVEVVTVNDVDVAFLSRVVWYEVAVTVVVLFEEINVYCVLVEKTVLIWVRVVEEVEVTAIVEDDDEVIELEAVEFVVDRAELEVAWFGLEIESPFTLR
jgi:hypothetical protein